MQAFMSITQNVAVQFRENGTGNEVRLMSGKYGYMLQDRTAGWKILIREQAASNSMLIIIENFR